MREKPGPSLRAGAAVLAALFVATLYGCRASQAGALPPDRISDPSVSVVPQPRDVRTANGTYRWPARVRIAIATPLAASGAKDVASVLRSRGNFASLGSGARADITFDLTHFPTRAQNAEGYRLVIAPSGVRIEAASAAGFYYGAQTLEQLARPFGGRALVSPFVTIVDWPQYRWRGIHLDVSRRFFPVDVVERYIGVAAHYKLNVFHWHLTDSQAWRMPIAGYPRLTAVTPAYSTADIRAVVAYAAQRAVTVVPEIDVPAHSSAAIRAYPQLACGRGGDELCASRQTFAFLDGVFTAVAALFPSPFVHVGGDESSRDAAFMPQIERTLRSHGKGLVGWDEIATAGVTPDAAIMSWRGEGPGLRALRAGHDVVFSPDGPLYFDAVQGDPSQEPRGTRYVSTLEEVYDYSPALAGIPPDVRGRALGVEAALWTTYVPSQTALFYQLLPRELALSETAWTPATGKDWPSFVRRLPAQLADLDAAGIPYRVPNAAFTIRGPHTRFVAVKGQVQRADAVTAADRVSVTIAAPVAGATVRFTIDGSRPTTRSRVFTGAFAIPRSAMPVVLRAIAVLRDGRAGTVTTCVVHSVSLQTLRGYVSASARWSNLVSP